jgi:uncharacterized protein with HEPN domain
MSSDEAALLDIIAASRRVIRYAQKVEKPELEADDEKQSAILYQIIVLGEAVKRLTSDFRERYPDIPWRQIAGMRDILAHQYDDVDFEVIWEATQNDMPRLLAMVEPLARDLDGK